MAMNNLYQLYDLVAQSTAGPIVQHTRHGSAVRQFHELLKDQTTTPGKYPEQFDLLWIGEQDNESAEITSRQPTPAARGADWKYHSLKQEQEATTETAADFAAGLRRG